MSTAGNRWGPHPARYGSPFAEARRLNAEGVIVTGAIIFPGDGGGQLDQLLRVEVRTQAVEYFIRYRHRRLRHCCRVAQHQLFQVGESRAILEMAQSEQLRFGYALFSAHGRTDVDSERAADSMAVLMEASVFKLAGTVLAAACPRSISP